MGQHLLRACQQHPKQLPLPRQRQRPVLGCLTAPRTPLHFTANGKSNNKQSRRDFCRAIWAGHSAGSTTEPNCTPPGAGKSLASASERHNGALPQPLPPLSWDVQKGFCCVIPQAVLRAPCLQTRGTQKLRQHSRSRSQRPWAETGLRSPPGHTAGQGASATAPGHPSSREGTRDLPSRVNLLLGTYSYRSANAGGEAEQDTLRHKAQLCKL